MPKLITEIVPKHNINLQSEYIFLIYLKALYKIIGNEDVEIPDEILDEALYSSADFLNLKELSKNLVEDIKETSTLDFMQLQNSKEQLKKYKNKTLLQTFGRFRTPILSNFRYTDKWEFPEESLKSLLKKEGTEYYMEYTFTKGRLNQYFSLFYIALYYYLILKLPNKIPLKKFTLKIAPDVASTSVMQEYIFAYTLWDYNESSIFIDMNIDFDYPSTYDAEINYGSMLSYYTQKSYLLHPYSVEAKYKEATNCLKAGGVCVLYHYTPNKGTNVKKMDTLLKRGATQIAVVNGYDEKGVDLTVLKALSTVEQCEALVKKDIDEQNMHQKKDTDTNETYTALTYIPKINVDKIDYTQLRHLSSDLNSGFTKNTYPYETIGIGGCAFSEETWLVPLGPLHENKNNYEAELSNPTTEVINSDLYTLPPYEHIYTLLRDAGVEKFDRQYYFDTFLTAELARHNKTNPTYDEKKAEVKKKFEPIQFKKSK